MYDDVSGVLFRKLYCVNYMLIPFMRTFLTYAAVLELADDMTLPVGQPNHQYL